MTVEQKVRKELKYLTEAMGLDPAQQKYWWYKLKREYEAQEKLRIRMEQRQAKKDYRKLLKKYGIGNDLDQIDDFSAFYNAPDQSEGSTQDKEDELMFQNERERAFYNNGKDMDFVRYHKRVTINFKEAL